MLTVPSEPGERARVTRRYRACLLCLLTLSPKLVGDSMPRGDDRANRLCVRAACTNPQTLGALLLPSTGVGGGGSSASVAELGHCLGGSARLP